MSGPGGGEGSAQRPAEPPTMTRVTPCHSWEWHRRNSVTPAVPSFREIEERTGRAVVLPRMIAKRIEGAVLWPCTIAFKEMWGRGARAQSRSRRRRASVPVHHGWESKVPGIVPVHYGWESKCHGAVPVHHRWEQNSLALCRCTMAGNRNAPALCPCTMAGNKIPRRCGGALWLGIEIPWRCAGASWLGIEMP